MMRGGGYMLKQIELVNYRCFEHTKMSIREVSVIVGKNNSGKSTLVEALRMVSMASKKCTSILSTLKI